jgi:hypothetical protein
VQVVGMTAQHPHVDVAIQLHSVRLGLLQRILAGSSMAVPSLVARAASSS